MIPQFPPPSVSPQQHKLKCWPEFFIVVQGGLKNFEIRKNDRDYKVGDELVLQEFSPCGLCNGTGRVEGQVFWPICECMAGDKPKGRYTGHKITRYVSYVTPFEQKPDNVVMALQLEPVCPACGTLEVSKRRGLATGIETDFMSCDDCDNQWGHQ